MKNNELRIANKEILKAWDTNAGFWDERMGKGNDFFNILEWPAILRLLDVQAAQSILDIATGNGLIARRLASLGVQVTAFDFSARLIELAKTRPNPDTRIAYHVIDGTDEKALLSLEAHAFDAALCNMALFNMAEIEPLFRTLPKILRAGAAFVFTICPPAFNNSLSVHIAEEQDQEGSMFGEDFTLHEPVYRPRSCDPGPTCGPTLFRTNASVLFQPWLCEWFRSGWLRGICLPSRTATGKSASLWYRPSS